MSSSTELTPIKANLRRGVPVGRDLFMRCGTCGDVIPTQPDDGRGCSCGNIFVDVDYGRIKIDRVDDVQLLKRA